MANNKSDYRDPRTNLFELLPNVLRSRTNEAVFEDVFNRYLSSSQIERVDGYVGQTLPDTVATARQIQEPTACRQAFQLQPLLSAKLGTENFLSSYEDILNELARTGVDECRLPLWGNALQFNWIPPVDIDKIVNFRDYYWYDPANPADDPQYITIENRCNKATQRVQAFQVTIDTFGETFPIVALSTANSSITIDGNIATVFTTGFVFFVQNSTNPSIDNTAFTVASSSYDPNTDTTEIVVQESIADDSIVDGDVSLAEFFTVLQTQANCFCGGDVGWSGAPWDDNQIGDVVWTEGLLNKISWDTPAEWVSEFTLNPLPGSPVPLGVTGGVPNLYSIWYDTTNNQLRQWDGASWVVLYNNFSAIVDLNDGTHRWDLTTTCLQQANPWIEQNKWFHQNHVPNFAIAKQAQLPIIEYDDDIDLNSWNFARFLWEYRVSQFTDFAVVTDENGQRAEPTLNELIPFKYIIGADGGLDTITLSPTHGDRTEDYQPGTQFRIEGDTIDSGNNGLYTVASVTYANTAAAVGTALATIITVTPDNTFSSANQSEDSVPTGSPLTVVTSGSGGRFVPQRTSQGDPFRGYNEHWLFVDQEILPVPAPQQAENPFVSVDPLTPATLVPLAGTGSPAVTATFVTSQPINIESSFGVPEYLYSIEYTTQDPTPPSTIFALDPRMANRARVGDDNIRVFINGIQQYGTFIERDDLSPSNFTDAIELLVPTNQFDVITISVSEAATVDTGRELIPVRTVRNNSDFIDASTGSPPGIGSPLTADPVETNLIRYRFVQQSKTQTNQYPLFDVFQCDGTPLFAANPLFAYAESQDAPINREVQRRIVERGEGNYQFQQFLIDPTTQPQPVIYSFKLNGELQTIWRKGLNDEEYVPQYVDVNLEPTTVGDPNGCWEIPDQLYFNTQHENREFVTFAELITHFRSILGEQNNAPGYVVPGNQAYLLQDVNYGLGGRIKEFNDSYDTFLSSAFVDNVTPLGVIDFAHDQYENSLNTIKELYRSNLSDFLTNTSSDFINDFQNTITNFIINTYETNDFFALVYGDSNTFIQGSPEVGIKNWPATLPFIELGFKKQPYIIEDETLGVLQLVHHDGHRSEPALTPTTRESIIQITLNTPDPRTGGTETYGVQISSPFAFGSPSVVQPTTPPDQFDVLASQLTPRSGVYWYDIGDPNNRTLYRFSVSAVGEDPPSGVPVGALWYDTDTDTLRELQPSLLWQPVAGLGSPSVGTGTITAAWEEIDLNKVLVNILLEVEQRLFEAAPDFDDIAFDINDWRTTEVSCPTRSTTVTEDDTAELYFEQAFSTYLRDQQIADPFSADQFFDATDAFTWNYSFSTPITPPVPAGAFGSPAVVPSGGWYLDLYTKLYGTPYPHLEPWKLQGYDEKPDWWDGEYLNDDPATYGNRRWKYIHRCGGSPCTLATGSPLPAGGPGNNVGMWENIRRGIVPVGQQLPNGGISTGAIGEASLWGATWSYFSVNVDDIELDGYAPDDLLPPFWDFLSNGGSTFNRSVFSNFAGEIVLPSADYTYQTGAPAWVDWTQSSQRLYDDLTVGYRLQPVRFIHNTFGVDFLEVGGKQINKDTCKVYSHRDVQFYGDIVNTNEVLQIRGINQWYVNFNRFTGFDASASNFRPLWQEWEPLLTYQFGSIIDTQTFQISNSNFDVNERDYQILLKRSPGIETRAIDAFNVTVLESPDRLASADTQNLWKFQVDTFFPVARDITYYEVHKYPVSVDTTTNTFTVYQYRISGVDAPNGNFILAGDQTDAFTTSFDFVVTGSSGNNGSYTATEVAFDPISNTTVVMTGSSLPSSNVGGVLTASYRTHPWNTGDVIQLQSSQVVPSPLRANLDYYVIKINDTQFQLASTRNDAITARPINIASVGSGNITAGQVFSKFVALDGAATDRQWNHYVIDRRFTRSFTPPGRITGMQNLINVVDGYATIKSEEGWDVNFERAELDPDTSNPVTWQLEMERFIDQAFRLPKQRARLPDSFGVTVDPSTNVFTFGTLSPGWTTGTKIKFSSQTTLPAPLLPDSTYFLIRDTEDTFRIALTATDAILQQEVDIISGVGAQFSVYEATEFQNKAPAIEINPLRNNVWIQSPRGILSNVVTGPSQDIRNNQLVVNQLGEQLTAEELSVFRLDRISRVFVPEPIRNPTIPLTQQTPYNTLHMSGMNLFFDGYECVILFNDYSVEDVLIYDPFVGLNTARFFMKFFRQDEFTQRPNVGGYYLTQDDQILRNIEANVKDLEQIYDTYNVLETAPLIKEGRRSLGYGGPGSLPYLEDIGLNAKSQFLFWRGFIQTKGSINAINAFTNNILFEDAIVDEYWAFKVAEFGSNYQQEYPALNLVIEDSRRSEKRFEFLPPSQSVGAADDTFEGVLLSNQQRWYNQPNVLTDLADNNLSMYFDAEITSSESFRSATPGNGSPQLWYYEPQETFDDVVLLEVDTSTNTATQLTEGVEYNRVNAKLISFPTNPDIILGPTQEYRLYTINPAKNKINPSKVIDVKDDIVISDVIAWDPARNNQYHIANNVVTFESDNDPASYTNALDLSQIDNQFWNFPEVGETWWDTLERGYKPYYDRTIFSLDDRIQNWGQLADWADVRLFQWTESDIPPEQWDEVAAEEELDITIDPQIRKTGRVRLEVSQRERTPLDAVAFYPSTHPGIGSPIVSVANCIEVVDPTSSLSIGDRIVFTTDDELPLPIEIGTFYFVVSIDAPAGSPATRTIKISETENGPVVQITPGPIFVDVSGNASDTGSPQGTGLLNDFDTAGIQDVAFATTKGLGSATGLATGTSGYQQIEFGSPSIPIATNTLTNIFSGGQGQQIVSFSAGGSPTFFCGADTGLSAGVYNFTITFDGGAPQNVVLTVSSTPYTFIQLAGAILGQLGGAGTVSCEASANGLVFTSATSGPASTVNIVNGPALPFGITPLFTAITSAGPWTSTINPATPGVTAPDFDASVTVDGSFAQTITVNGANATTFGQLVTEINNDLSGATASIESGILRITSNTTGQNSTISISDNDLFSSVKVGSGSPLTSGAPGPSVSGTGTTYQTAISVNGGGQQLITITGDEAQTYAQLLDILNLNITGASAQLTTALIGSPTTVIRLASDATGLGSSIDIIDPVPSSAFDGIFSSLLDAAGSPNRPTQLTPIDGVDATTYEATIDLGNGARLVSVIGNQAQTFAELIEEINDQLTSGFIAATPDDNLQIQAGNNTVEVVDGPGINPPLFASLQGYQGPLIPVDTGEGAHNVVPPFRDDAWVQLRAVRKELFDARDKGPGNTFDATVAGTPPNNIAAGDVVDVYKNGSIAASNVTVDGSGNVILPGTQPQDYITVVKPKHVITEEEAAFDPDVFDDGTNLIQYREQTNYTEVFTVDQAGNKVPRYYFWVENKTVRENNNPSLRQAAIDLTNAPVPYTIFDKLLPEKFGGSPQTLLAPKRYTQLIVRGLAGIVDDTDRYVLRFTRDFTLRDQLNARNYTTDLPAAYSRVGQEPLDLKTLHTEWTLIREKQPVNIPRELWDKITESIVARKLNNPSVRVPSLSRELYDLEFDAQTRYGLRDGQAFVRGDLALATLLDDLQDPNNDFTPVDINAFFATQDFTTEQGIIDAMDDIYNTFPFEAVNRIYFKVLLDAFTTKAKYPDIFKTSWVSLSGTQILQTEELFGG